LSASSLVSHARLFGTPPSREARLDDAQGASRLDMWMLAQAAVQAP